MLEIRIHGRGGQGTVVASKILAVAFFAEGKYVQAFPHFGVERRGAPVTAFIRVGSADESEMVRCAIYTPDHLIILDPTLLLQPAVFQGFKDGGWVVVNTSRGSAAIRLPVPARLATVNATEIAVRNKLGSATSPIVNVPMAAAFARATGLLSLRSVLSAVKEEVPTRVAENLKAAETAYEQVCAADPSLARAL